MKTYRSLTIRAQRLPVAQLIPCLDHYASAGWCRDAQAESLHPAAGHEQLLCFTRHAPGAAGCLAVWLRVGRDDLEVAAVTCNHRGWLTPADYNAVVEDFHRHVAAPAADLAGAAVDLGKDEIDLADHACPAVLVKLRHFALGARKHWPCAPPPDDELWIAFLLEAHRRAAALSPGLLERWLREEQRWIPAVAEDMADQYEFARDLLAAYDRGRAS